MQRLLPVVLISALTAVCVGAPAGGALERPGGVKVLCWNHHAPKKGYANVKANPRKCSLYRRGYDFEAAGAVHMHKLKWKHWGNRKTTAKGEYFQPMDVNEPWKPVKVKLKKPVDKCGHIVYSKAAFDVPGAPGHYSFPLWTC